MVYVVWLVVSALVVGVTLVIARRRPAAGPPPEVAPAPPAPSAREADLAWLARLPYLELRSLLRVKVDRVSPHGPSTCARPLTAGFEARVVVDGLEEDPDQPGLPPVLRDRISAPDHVVFELALDQTLPDDPPVVVQAPGPARLWQLPGWVWLCLPDVVLEATPSLVVAGDEGLVWAEGTDDHFEVDVLGLCGHANRGPLPLAMWAWDGVALSEAEVIREEPTTRHGVAGHVVVLPPRWAELIGVDPMVDLRNMFPEPDGEG